MQYLIYFYKDKEIVVAKAEDIFLGEFEGYSLLEWKNSRGECRVKVVYGEECFDACVLQVGLKSEN